MNVDRWKLHLSVALLAIAAMVVALTPAVADPVPETEEYPDVAFLARNDVPFDAQTAASMAAQLGAPMFITAPDALSEAAAGGIADLNPDVLIVAGGQFAISDAVANQAAAQCEPDCDIDRRFGAGRDATAAALAGIAADYGFDRPVLQGDNHVAGDVHVDGTLSTHALTVEDTGLVSGLNADRLDGMHADDFLGAGEQAADSDKVDGIDSPQLQMPDVLPSGRTLQGVYATTDESSNDSLVFFGNHVTVQPPLPADLDDPQVHFIPVGDSPPAECPGTIDDPQADPGHLCIYERAGDGYRDVHICSPTSGSCPAADRLGFEILLANDDVAGTISSEGSWAVTAP